MFTKFEGATVQLTVYEQVRASCCLSIWRHNVHSLIELLLRQLGAYLTVGQSTV